ncbi:MAG: selenocysteine-specific translation elongation factor [Planctomycetes bacterium]|nr:selenocysteine-specific translation elongation factor [Planctomycetota bacterium]
MKKPSASPPPSKKESPRDPQPGGGFAKIYNVIVGTAGHIDHGKTTLVEKLTGINPDRLPEEKERGMTIDLGFSRYQLQSGQKIGIIDVPGHERFVKNMVAGATGIDLVLLVVAADDGVMPQTREHLEIMKLLGIQHGIIVVTKIDMVSPELRELATEDILAAVKGTFLEKAPLVPVSSVTGEGLDRLKAVLQQEVLLVKTRSTTGVFRMPVQRVFSSKGFGTVLTGVPMSGKAVVGDTLEVLPLGKKGRVRGVQAYQSAAEMAQAGQSSAINLTDLDYKEVHRGMVLAAPGYFQSSTLVEARFSYLPSIERPLRHLREIRFHCGTAEILGRIYLLEGKELRPGQSTFVQLRLQEPVVAAPGDRFVLRLHSPMVTIGGGEVIDLSRFRLKQGKAHIIEKLESKAEAVRSPKQLLLHAVQDRGYEAVLELEAARDSGLPAAEAQKVLQELIEEGAILTASRSGLYFSSIRFEEAKAKAREVAVSFFQKKPKRLLMEKVALRQAVPSHEVFFQDLLAALEKEGRLKTVRGEYLQWTFHAPQLTDREKGFREQVLKAIREQAFSPPRVEEVAAQLGVDSRTAGTVGELLLEEGELVKASEEAVFHREAIEEARRRLREHLEKAGTMTASEAKNLLGSSRKYIIPLLEMLDQEGFTIRRGDVRELRKN